MMGLQESPDLAQIALGSFVAGPIASTLSVLFAFALVFISSRLVGGTGTYVKQANSMSLVLCGSNTLLLAFILVAFAISLPSFLLHESAFWGTLAGFVTVLANLPVLALCLAIVIYTIYAYYLVVRKAHNLSAWRAAGVIVASAALVLIADVAASILLRG